MRTSSIIRLSDSPRYEGLGVPFRYPRLEVVRGSAESLSDEIAPNVTSVTADQARHLPDAVLPVKASSRISGAPDFGTQDKAFDLVQRLDFAPTVLALPVDNPHPIVREPPDDAAAI